MPIMEIVSSIIAGLKLPIKILAGIVFIFTTILLFAPNSFLSKLFVLNLRNDNKEIIGLFWILSVCVLVLYVCLFFAGVFKEKIDTFFYKRKLVNQLKVLSPRQKQLLKSFYVQNNKGKLDYTSADASVLEALNIIGRAPVSVGGTVFEYFLHPWVIEYIDKNQDFLKQ